MCYPRLAHYSPARFVNLGIFDVDSLQCARPSSDFYSRVVMQVAGPILISLMIFAVAKLRTWQAASEPDAELCDSAAI